VKRSRAYGSRRPRHITLTASKERVHERHIRRRVSGIAAVLGASTRSEGQANDPQKLPCK